MSRFRPPKIHIFRALLIGIYGLMFLPVIVVIATSLTVQPHPTIPSEAISLQWYAALLENSRLIAATRNSVIVALLAAAISSVIGLISAFGLVRGDFPYREYWSTAMLLPLMISPVITGIAVLIFLSEYLHVESGFLRTVIAHVSLVLPYVFLFVRSELLSFNRTFESASRSLGANHLETTFHVTLPLISTSLISSFFVAFIVSFGEFTATQFLVTPESETVPIIIYTMLRSGLSPEISALSAILVIGMVLVTAVSTLGGD